MNTKALAAAGTALALSAVFTQASLLGTAFTYQGQLTDGGAPANGIYDLKFTLFGTNSDGLAIAGPLTNSPVAVSNGLFTTTLDFGADVFNGEARWLEIAVRANGAAGDFTLLSPRQLLTPAPYALHAAGAATANSVPAGNLTGTLPDASLSTNVALLSGSPTFAGMITAAAFAGNGGALTNLDSTRLTGPLRVRSTLVNIGVVHDSGPPQEVAIAGHYAYLANGYGRLRIYDATNPTNLVSVGYAATDGYAFGVAVSGNYAFVAEGSELEVFDVSNPSNIVPLGGPSDAVEPIQIAVAGQYAYVADGQGGLRIYDISNPSNLVTVGHINDGAEVSRAVAVSGGYAYLANTLDGLRIYNVSDPSNLVSVAHVHDGGANGSAADVAVAGHYAYVANAYDGLRIYEVSNPSNVVNVAHVNDGGVAFGVAVAGRYCYVGNYDDGLRIYDISDPRNPVSAAHIRDAVAASAVAVTEPYIYLCDRDTGLRTYFFEEGVSAPRFEGNGSRLMDLNATSISNGTLADARLSENVAVLNADQLFVGANGFLGRVEATNAANVMVGTFSGDGGGLTNLNGSGGSTNAALLDANQTFTGSNTFAGVTILTNKANSIVGNFTGDGAGLTNLSGAGLAPGSMNGTALQSGALTADKIAVGQVVKSLNALRDDVALVAGANIVLATNGNTLEISAVGGGTNGGWGLNGNSGTSSNNFIGTTDNQPLEFRVNGQRALRLEYAKNVGSPCPNVIMGGQNNTIATLGSTIGGGSCNTIQTNAGTSFIGGGSANTIESAAGRSFLGGGSDNTIQTNAFACFLGGGDGNTIQTNAHHSFLGGGYLNSIQRSAEYSFLGGGWYNTIQANAYNSFLGGGEFNAVLASYSFLGGGGGNRIHQNAFCSFLGGGNGNIIEANSQHATISGGRNNLVRSESTGATIPGGLRNVAGGECSLAAGMRAQADHDGSFVWGDFTDADIASTNANSVTMRASGGYRLFSNSGATTGVYLAPGGGSWTSMSDRSAKENLAPVNGRDVLEAVAALPVSTWNYKSQDASIRHLGPMAQDFQAAFGVGESDTGITGVDADGVAMAAIQGLNQKFESENAALRAENAELKARLERLEQLIISHGHNSRLR